MLQRIPQETKTSKEVGRFLLDLQAVGFDGEIATDTCSRAVASTDNSIWQVMPQVIISPKSRIGVEQVLKILASPSHRSVSVTARGGGTSTAGQSLTNSIVLDCKRYMHRVLDFNTETNQIEVECGAVLEQVNDELQQYGVMIGPTVATSSRATIGGMIGNDSAGKGSQIYGKMSDCVVSLETIIRGGSMYCENPTLVSAVKHACDAARPHFHKQWPPLPRFLSGYNLPMAWDGVTFDSNRIFCGAEGTLGITTSAVLQCVPIPTDQVVLLICFNTFDRALRCGAALAKHKPLAIETVDEMVLETARNDASWENVSALLDGAKDETNALLFVECRNVNVNSLMQTINSFDPLHINVLNNRNEQKIAWSFRSRSVGLLSSLQGTKKPIPFVEDCAVLPEKLPDFIDSFKALLAKHDMRAGMFGHVDGGVIHVRPGINMQNKDDRNKVRDVSQEVVSLVRSFGGVLWGEHGKGFRSEFGPTVFGDVIWEQMCNIKSAFDPHNQFNPGKVAVPNTTFEIANISTTTRGENDETAASIPVVSNALHCDGNSECQSVVLTSEMCPTYRATDDPTQSPRGRSEVIRYWLARIGKSTTKKKQSFIRRFLNTGTNDDFNHEVKHVLDTCVSCKACATKCPMQVDVPSMRSVFYNIYFNRYLRPLRDIIWLNMERGLKVQRYFPARTLASVLGICDPPTPSYTLRKQIKTETPEEIVKQKPDLVLLQDSFTTYFRPEVFIAMLKIAEHLGERVSVLPLKQNGKALHTRGSLEQFKTVANSNIKWLSPLQELGIPIIGIDPAATLLWREEYPENQTTVLLPQEWLINQDLSTILIDNEWRLFPHCIEKNIAQQSNQQWQQVFKKMGGELQIVETACCGMGGLFGHQKEFKQLSLEIWDIHWAKHEPRESDSLTTGYSCTSQAKRIENIELRHPLEIIANSIH